jgi:hypothetical protein
VPGGTAAPGREAYRTGTVSGLGTVAGGT